jgi:hypothetical protein
MKGIFLMEKITYHPLGSVLIVRGGIKKMMIIARGIAAEINGATKVFDYAGCAYPEGLVGDQIMYFNHADIAKVVFEGFQDEDENMMVENINNWLKTTPFERGNPLELNEQNNAAASKGGS